MNIKTWSVISILMIIVFATNICAKSELEQKLERVVEDFRVSINEHSDEEKFSNLFLHETITWVAIYTGKTRKARLEENPSFRYSPSNYKTFYSKMRDGYEEKFYNLDMNIRKEFATVSFDYTFSIDSKLNNWGTEYWSLVLVEGEWKITSVTFSVNLQRFEKSPF